jgi:hypothetical protein
MCPSKFHHILRVSNRGDNVVEQVANQTYAVNIPPELRIANKQIKISVINATMAFNTDSTFETYTEIGVTSNLGAVCGFDSEVSGSFRPKNFELLFNIDTSTFGRQNNKLITFHTHSEAFSFWTNQLPERLIFSSVASTTGVLTPITNDNYISFILKLEYYDNDGMGYK